MPASPCVSPVLIDISPALIGIRVLMRRPWERAHTCLHAAAEQPAAVASPRTTVKI